MEMRDTQSLTKKLMISKPLLWEWNVALFVMEERELVSESERLSSW